MREVNAEVNQLIEKRMMSGDPMDDKLSLFRQQVLINWLYFQSFTIHWKSDLFWIKISVAVYRNGYGLNHRINPLRLGL